MLDVLPQLVANDGPRAMRAAIAQPDRFAIEPKIDGVRVLIVFRPDGVIETRNRRGQVRDWQRHMACVGLVIVALGGCSGAPYGPTPSSASTETVRTGSAAPPTEGFTASVASASPATSASEPIDRECYLSYLWPRPGGINVGTLGVALPAPTNQPWVNHPEDCRYNRHHGIDRDVSDLDPEGCYGLDPGGGALIYRSDFCAPTAAPS